MLLIILTKYVYTSIITKRHIKISWEVYVKRNAFAAFTRSARSTPGSDAQPPPTARGRNGSRTAPNSSWRQIPKWLPSEEGQLSLALLVYTCSLHPARAKYPWVGCLQEDEKDDSRTPHANSLFMAADNTMITIGGGYVAWGYLKVTFMGDAVRMVFDCCSYRPFCTKMQNCVCVNCWDSNFVLNWLILVITRLSVFFCFLIFVLNKEFWKDFVLFEFFGCFFYDWFILNVQFPIKGYIISQLRMKRVFIKVCCIYYRTERSTFLVFFSALQF